jgi:colanic acid/amylovoran biosynthesis glycosyltransferase
LPVISTPIGGIERAIENEVTGYLVEPNSSDDLFKRMYFLSKNTECWNDISIQARDRIEENFDKTKQLKYIDDLYNRLMDESIGLTQVQ